MNREIQDRLVRPIVILLIILLVLPLLLGLACDNSDGGNNVRDGGTGIEVVDCQETPDEAECQQIQVGSD